LKYIFTTIFTLLFLLNNTQAQELDTLKKRYPNDNAVFSKVIQNYDFDVSRGEIKVTGTYYSEQMYTNGNAQMYSNSNVYNSSFRQAHDIEAFTRIGKKEFPVKTFTTKTNESRNIFFDDSKEITFSFPNAQVGATSVLSYATTMPNIYLLPDIYFDSYLPIDDITVTVTVDKDIDLKYIPMNVDETIIFKKEESRKKNIYTWTSQHRNKYESENFESDAANRDYYTPHILLYVASFEGKDKKETVLGTTKDLYKWCYGNVSPVLAKENNNNTVLKNIADSLTKNCNTPEAKLEAIYTWVQSKIYYVAFEDSLAGFIPRQPSLVAERKYGDCKDMACLLQQLLTHVGIKAYPTWIGTRDIMYDVNKVPLAQAFNHMITAAELNGKLFYLDPTNNYLPYRYPSYSIQGKQALMLVDKDNYKLETVPTMQVNDNTELDSMNLKIEKNNIIGNLHIANTGYSALQSRYYTNSITAKDMSEDLSRYLRRASAKCFITNATVQNDKDKTQPHIFDATIKLDEYVNTINNNLYVNMNFKQYYRDHVYDVAKRVAPVENNYNYNYTNKIILEIPTGYKVNYLPEAYTYNNENFDCTMSYKTEGNKIVYTQIYICKQLYFAKSYFADWNKFVKKLSKNYKETVVLEPVK
jgi:transglutaminase-like putative cysteine protease